MQNLDTELLFLINKKWQNSFFDFLFPNITDLHKNFIFIILVLLFITILIYLFKRPAFILVCSASLSVGFTDFICGEFIKPAFARLRPTQQHLDIIVRAPEYGGFSFVSNHAANMFCLASFIYSFHKKTGLVIYFFAFLISYSRIYVGVHFPSDVVFGAIIGICIGTLSARIFKKKVSVKWQKS